ncbi:MAG: trypsin-like peptidase domain-containing protein [Nitrospirae bacterium]|nr:trypsin-like peptidase domain-containing protein [Nitrospirota bacterium]
MKYLNPTKAQSSRTAKAQSLKIFFPSLTLCLCASMSSVVLIFLLFTGTSAWSREDMEDSKKVIDKWNDAVITVKVVSKFRVIVEGREVNKGENEAEAIATVIDPSGLAVLSNSTIDPARVYTEIVKAKAGREGMSKFSMDTEVSDIKMLMPDGAEIPAKVVLKDSDMDMAFIMPVAKPDRPIKALDLSKEASTDILDNILILSRLGRVAGRVPSISMHRVEAIIKKPRTFYVIDQNILDGKLGSPVFSTDGKVIGIFLLRVVESGQKSSLISNLLGINTFGVMSVILPAGEIMEIARQALEIKDKEKIEK